MNVNETLQQRKKSYGDFKDVAFVAMQLKDTISAFFNCCCANPDDAFKQEALDMICSKIARIVCGDSNHVDSWHDIAGYAQLVVNELEKQAHEAYCDEALK